MTRIEVLWQEISQEAALSRIPEGEFRLVRIDSQHPFQIYAGVDGIGSLMLAIGVSARPPVIDVDMGALNYIRVQRAGGNWIMVLRLEGSGLEQVFGRLCQDLIDTAVHVATEAALVSLFRERLLLWTRLFRAGTSGLLQKFQIKGLIAELLALEALIAIHSEDPVLPVVSWIGPSGADQDFLFADRAIEIKSVSPDAEKVSISSAGQLDPTVPMELHVHVLRESSPSESAAITLPVLIARIEQLVTSKPMALNAYRDKLIEAGYVEHDYYLRVAYTLMDTRRYEVRGDFPRVIRSELPSGIPDVTYSILLSSIAQFEIPETSNAG